MFIATVKNWRHEEGLSCDIKYLLFVKRSGTVLLNVHGSCQTHRTVACSSRVQNPWFKSNCFMKWRTIRIALLCIGLHNHFALNTMKKYLQEKLYKFLDYVSLNNKRKVNMGGYGRRIVDICLKTSRRTKGRLDLSVLPAVRFMWHPFIWTSQIMV
jgi:hypothetical protein